MKLIPEHLRLTSAVASAIVLGVLLQGCSQGLSSASYTHPVVTSSATTGRVYGGQQPVAGSTLQLYAVGINGLRSAATPLIASTIVTRQDGSFTITGDWDCTSNTAAYGVNPLLYIVASGGNPGLPDGTNNAALRLMAALGPCSTVNSSTSILINEVTTVGAVYALAPFMADFAHVGAAGANSAGLVNAFNNANLLVNWNSGSAPGNLPADAAAPVAELNSLGDILATCVNSTGTDGLCATLFAAATPAGGTPPTDTVGVILNIASAPASKATDLFNTILPAAPFVPQLLAPPSDWTVSLNFTGGGLSAPAALALDATGNVWVANASGNSVTELSPTGTQLTGSAGYSGSGNLLGAQGIAIDEAGNVWVADTLLSSVVELKLSNGVIQSASSFTGGGIDGPVGIAVDNQNNIWIANFAGSSVTELNSAGSAVGASPLTAGATLQAPWGVAVDSSGHAWVTDDQGSDVVEFGSDQSLLSGSGYTDSAVFAPQGIAIDSAGRAWAAYQGTNAVGSYLNGLNALVSNPLTGGGLSLPTAVAIDGAGTVWIANGPTAGSLTEVSGNQTAPSGLGALNAPSGIAIDASGSIWTANTGDNSLSEFIGAAVPTTLPLVSLHSGPAEESIASFGPLE